MKAFHHYNSSVTTSAPKLELAKTRPRGAAEKHHGHRKEEPVLLHHMSKPVFKGARLKKPQRKHLTSSQTVLSDTSTVWRKDPLRSFWEEQDLSEPEPDLTTL